MVKKGEPVWLPEDRDVLQVWLEFKRSRHECGRWEWEWDDFDDYELDYTVCPFCQEVSRAYIREADRRKDMFGVSFGYFPSNGSGYGEEQDNRTE